MLEVPKLPAIIEHLDPVLCCCRKSDCDAVLSNRRVMQQLELDLRTAAEIGQRILLQHDDYVKHAEADKVQLLEEIKQQTAFAQLVDELEFNNRELEDRNLRAMRENAELLKRLENLNASLSAADYRNQELRGFLNDTEKEVSKLSYEAVQAKGLDSQILMVELEREGLTKELEDMTRDNKISDTRYRKAEQYIKDLQEQLDQVLCLEAEQHKHSQLPTHSLPSMAMSGLGRQTSSRNNLEPAGADANDEDSDVLRRTLAESRSEVEQLQKQIQMYQQGANSASEGRSTGPRKSVSQELHQHHHYHYHVPAQASETKVKSHLSNDKSLTPQAGYTGFSSISDTPLSTFTSHVETSTPIRQPQKSGLCSPPSSRRKHRDSGYFSFASEMTRDMSASLTRPSSPALLGEDIEDSVQQCRGRHLRSNSHESIFATADLSYERITANNALTHRKSLNCLATELAWATEETGQSSQEPVLPRRTTPQAPPSQAQSLLNRLQSSRRPFPSPLQGTASSPTVSTSTTSATTQSSTRQDVIILPGAQVNRSYNALRSAAAAQRLSPSISSPQNPGNSVFWRPHSDKGVPMNGRSSRSAKWASFVGWSSKGSSTGGKNELPDPGSCTQKHYDQEASAVQSVGTSVQLSTADEDLLREALA